MTRRRPGILRSLRLAPVAAAAWGTAFWATRTPEWSAAAALALWGACAGAMIVLAVRHRASARDRRFGLVIIVALAAAAASVSHVALAEPARSAARTLGVDGGRAITVHAVVTGKVERWATGQLVFDALASRLDVGADAHPLAVEVAVVVDPADVASSALLDVGATIRARGTLAPARPGERAVWTMSASRGIEVTAEPQGILIVGSALRRGLIDAVAGLPAPGAGLVPGLAVGDTSAVDPALDADMKTASLSHLTAVSGANCAIVVGLAFAAAAALGARRTVRVAAGIGALGGFVLLVTPEPSVVRAAAMGAIAMIAVQLGRAGPGIAVLSLAVTVLLVADPWLAGSLGFALSVVATASLLLWARPLAEGMARRMPRALALALSVPLAAQLACGPLLVLIVPAVPLYGVAANLLAAPAAPVATIVGLLACLALPVPALASGLAAVAWLPASWIAGTATTFARLPWHTLPWLDGWLGVIAMALTGGAVGLVVRGRPRVGERRRATLHLGALAVVAIVGGVVAGGGALSSFAGRYTIPGQWTLAACDIGQGDAVVLRSADRVGLVDTGQDPELLNACLTRLGIATIDLLVLTHFDLDHVGGVAAVRGRVAHVLHGPPGEAADVALIADLAAHGAEPLQAGAGVHGTLGASRWRVLWPRAQSKAFPPGNDAGLVLELTGGGLPSALLLADLSAGAQRSLAASGTLRPPYTVVKVAHHGSADQDPALYAAVAASVGVISVGAGNTYGHPRDEVLQMLEEQGTTVARTDREGLVLVWSEGESIAIWRERGPPGVVDAQ